MDDMTIITKTVTEARWMLQDLGHMIAWARMQFKPVKSRSLAMKRGRVQNKVKFKIGTYHPNSDREASEELGKVVHGHAQ